MSETVQNLVKNLEETIKVYRGILTVVRSEREILVSANLDELSENNVTKEKILLKSKKLERERLDLVDQLVQEQKLPVGQIPTLKELANHYGGPVGERLMALHTALELLVQRVREINARNEKLVKVALENITGAMKSIKDMLDDNKTYEKKGKMQDKGQSSGRFVSKQV